METELIILRKIYRFAALSSDRYCLHKRLLTFSNKSLLCTTADTFYSVHLDCIRKEFIVIFYVSGYRLCVQRSYDTKIIFEKSLVHPFCSTIFFSNKSRHIIFRRKRKLKILFGFSVKSIKYLWCRDEVKDILIFFLHHC